MTNHETGLKAEMRAAAYLKEQGFAIIAERYRNAYGEIDLIARKQDELRFVEVKARRNLSGSLHALSVKQQQRIVNCALGFLAEYPHYESSAMQFDLIAIAGSQLQHETNIVVGE